MTNVIAKTFGISFAALFLASAGFAGQYPMVGGAEMFPTKSIAQNASASADHTTLVAAVTAAGLVETLDGPGTFTVFAPTNAAFAALPAGTVDALLKPEAKDTLVKVLTCHVVDKTVMSEALVKMIADEGGMHKIPTLGGCMIEAKVMGDNVVLTDENGAQAKVTIADVAQSNGVVHVIDAVLTPKS